MPAYTERRHLLYTAQQLFDLVADVECYPEFLPWLITSHIRRREDRTVFVDMTVGIGPISRRFSSVGELHRPDRIDIRSDDPLFERFEQRWTFASGPEDGADVTYFADVCLKSRALQMLIGRLLADQASSTISAFEHRAEVLYGPPL